MRKQLAGVMFLCLMIGGCDQGHPKKMEVKIRNADGDEIGTADIAQAPQGLKIKVKAEGLEPGVHGCHIHEIGVCKGPDFISSGNHFNPDNKEHGLLNPKGAENGDLPNLIADDQGKVDAEIAAPSVSLKEGKTSLWRKDGASLIITENLDDGMSQPSGESGKRIACGVIVDKSTKNKTK
ncbi:superoxide dismutase family protein [Bacillus sp. 165]|uniref:superoxide dismutase family protein n=1 Tax=Bacillus sp. 165 TaxID=1529117 RepID=UPI001ADCABAB|nr:superoxide dismutase family protein [Bacillus sp. 165]MBO9130646.1 superoxide dismutase family protein [Bacillus sp. 165]